MKHLLPLVVLASLLAPVASRGQAPLRLHPENPRYLLFRGRPTYLLTSGEHYGAVLNGEFDYIPYLDELKARGFNQTRTFAGTYFEPPGAFGINDNTLGPAADKYVSPWPLVKEGKGRRYDLSSFNPAYFKRLHDFVVQAGKRGVVVELTLFCTFYEEKFWSINPMHAANNMNDVERVGHKDVFTVRNKKLLALQEKFVRAVVDRLKDCDNLYYEVCNEPYFAGVTPEWQHHIIETLVDAEAKLPHRHLIAQNIANKSAKVERPNPHVSIFNFHYATPPDVVALNAGLKKPIGDDETGFRGPGDFAYRSEAWEFLLAGGASYSNLDYSFSCKHPAGSGKVGKSPGGGGPSLRSQLQILREFLDEIDLVHMTPAPELVKAADPKTVVRCLAAPGDVYAIYVKGGSRAKLALKTPKGPGFEAEWVDTRTGAIRRREAVSHSTGLWELTAPEFTEDIALRVVVEKRARQKHIPIVIQTDLGDIEVELNGVAAPRTTANFLRYVDGKFYDGGRFHRTVTPKNQPDSKVKIEVIQAGIDPKREPEEYPPLRLERTKDTGLTHKDGAISMARDGPDTATSDFFICVGAQPELDFGGKRNPDGQGFAAFGTVVKGMEIVRKIQSAPAEGQTLTPAVKIRRIVRKGL
ncbi:MAG: peptidylprolyl isomerase [Gemmataceae bacterium]